MLHHVVRTAPKPQQVEPIKKKLKSLHVNVSVRGAGVDKARPTKKKAQFDVSNDFLFIYIYIYYTLLKKSQVLLFPYSFSPFPSSTVL